MNKLKFRIQDWPAAEREYNCIDSLQKELQINMERSNYATAELCIDDMKASIKEIRRLQKAKRESDRIAEIIEHMQAIGINAKAVTR